MKRGEAPHRPDHMPPRIIRARRRSARLRGATEDAEARQPALGPLLSRVVNNADLAVLSVILEQMDDLDDVARLRQTCRVLRDGVDACVKMKRMVAGERRERLNMNKDIPWQLMAWEQDWTRDSPWATWVARGDMRRERPDMTRALSQCDLAAVRVGRQYHEVTLLHVASCCGHAGMVMLLLGCGVDKDKVDEDRVTPLFAACFDGHLEVVRLLIEAGADKDKARNTDGVTPLYFASQEGHLEIVRLLVEAGADKDKARDGSVTPLWMASLRGHLEVVRLLIEAGADMDKANRWGSTPLFIASLEGHLEVVRLLVEKGADKDMAESPASKACRVCGLYEYKRSQCGTMSAKTGCEVHPDRTKRWDDARVLLYLSPSSATNAGTPTPNTNVGSHISNHPHPHLSAPVPTAPDASASDVYALATATARHEPLLSGQHTTRTTSTMCELCRSAGWSQCGTSSAYHGCLAHPIHAHRFSTLQAREWHAGTLTCTEPSKMPCRACRALGSEAACATSQAPPGCDLRVPPGEIRPPTGELSLGPTPPTTPTSSPEPSPSPKRMRGPRGGRLGQGRGGGGGGTRDGAGGAGGVSGVSGVEERSPSTPAPPAPDPAPSAVPSSAPVPHGPSTVATTSPAPPPFSEPPATSTPTSPPPSRAAAKPAKRRGPKKRKAVSPAVGSPPASKRR